MNEGYFPIYSDLFRLFNDIRRFKATDSRDKFYALLNLLGPDDAFLKPDFHRSLGRLYRDVVVEGISHSNSLCCITMGGCGVLHESDAWGLPSWIPDFDKIGDFTSFYAKPIFMLAPDGEIRFDACGSRAPEYTLSEGDEHKYLTAKGFICDKITTTMLELDGFETFRSIAKSLEVYDLRRDNDGTTIYARLFRTLFPPKLETSKDGDTAPFVGRSRKLMVSRFMLYGQAALEKHLKPKMDAVNTGRRTRGLEKLTIAEEIEVILCEGDAALAYVGLRMLAEEDVPRRNILRDQLCGLAATAFGQTADEVLADFEEATSGRTFEAVVARLRAALGARWGGRAFVVTEGGHMGFARPGTMVGDEVCILYGCPVPVIVQPAGERFLLVGDCRLEGMMNGEMVKRLDDGEFTARDLTFKEGGLLF